MKMLLRPKIPATATAQLLPCRARAPKQPSQPQTQLNNLSIPGAGSDVL